MEEARSFKPVGVPLLHGGQLLGEPSHDDWLFEGDLIHDAAETALLEGRTEAARDAFFTAARYLKSCGHYLFGPDHRRALGALRRGRACFVKAIEMSTIACEPFDIAYRNGSLPGFFLRAADATEPRATLLVCAGPDGTLEDAWAEVGQVAISAGYDVLAFDGPVHVAMMRDQVPSFGDDWQTVVRAVTDQVIQRADMDPGRLAVVGCGDDGQWVANAAALAPPFSVLIKNLRRPFADRVWDADVRSRLSNEEVVEIGLQTRPTVRTNRRADQALAQVPVLRRPQPDVFSPIH